MTLPNFIIPGAYKAGTTSLFKYLVQHPEVYGSPFKETRFFVFDPTNPKQAMISRSRLPVRTLEEYEAQFVGVTDEIAIGEASPVYFGNSFAIHKIRELIPDVRLIFCLRHPVDRLYSMYLMNYREGVETRSVYEVCRPGGQRATINKYSPRMRLWLENFDRKQIEVFVLERFRVDPIAEIQNQYLFLGVNTDFVPDFDRIFNPGGVPKNSTSADIYRKMKVLRREPLVRKLKPHLPSFLTDRLRLFRQSMLKKPDPMPDELANALKQYYQDDVRELERLLDIDLAIWELT